MSYLPWDERSEALNGELVCDNFRQWFGHSTVTDEEGDPLVVYLTNRKAPAFRPGMQG